MNAIRGGHDDDYDTDDGDYVDDADGDDDDDHDVDDDVVGEDADDGDDDDNDDDDDASKGGAYDNDDVLADDVEDDDGNVGGDGKHDGGICRQVIEPEVSSDGEGTSDSQGSDNSSNSSDSDSSSGKPQQKSKGAIAKAKNRAAKATATAEHTAVSLKTAKSDLKTTKDELKQLKRNFRAFRCRNGDDDLVEEFKAIQTSKATPKVKTAMLDELTLKFAATQGRVKQEQVKHALTTKTSDDNVSKNEELDYAGLCAHYQWLVLGEDTWGKIELYKNMNYIKVTKLGKAEVKKAEDNKMPEGAKYKYFITKKSNVKTTGHLGT